MKGGQFVRYNVIVAANEDTIHPFLPVHNFLGVHLEDTVLDCQAMSFFHHLSNNWDSQEGLS